MFRELITNADGSTAEGMCSDEHALSLLRKAVRLGYRTEATRHGGVIIVREIPGRFIPRKHTVTLEPLNPAARITDTARRDLGAIARRPGSSLVSGRIHAGLYCVPLAATARLVSHGLVTVTGTSVAVSLAARLAMLAQDHRTGTCEPRGYVHPSDIGLTSAGRNGGGGRSGLTYDRSSGASCSCRDWSYPAEDRETARRKAREHRQDVTAALVRDLT